MPSKRASGALPTTTRSRVQWHEHDDAALLALRFNELRLQPKASPIWSDVERLYAELERRGIGFRPHVWFSTEWFSPDGIPGIAIPFYVGHPRLQRLEQRMVGKVEGGTRQWRLRILRHEAGHALDSAFALRRRADWRAVFGPASRPYPRHYNARPNSRAHVLHLGEWYAQSHPTEDFAETFAVWLSPRARWRREYAGWPALEKLEYVDALMHEIAGRAPRIRDRSVVAPIADNGRKIKEHYKRRQLLYGHLDRRYDTWLRGVFPPSRERPSSKLRASRFLKELRTELRSSLVKHTLAGPYLVDHVMDTVTTRARQLDLVACGPRRDSRRRAEHLLEQIVFDILHRNRESYAL